MSERTPPTEEELTGKAKTLGDGMAFGNVSRRELFAAMAMQGYLYNDSECSTAFIAKECVELADALLKELAK